MSQKENNLIWAATLVNTHGVKGEVRILTNSDDPEKIFTKGSVVKYIENDVVKELTINSYRPHKQFILLTFEGIDNINDIEYLKGHKIYIDREELEDDEYYLSDLKDKPVFDQDNNEIGKVLDIVDQGPYENLIIELKDGSKTNIPMVDEFKVKFDKIKVEVNLPDGFID